MKRSYLISSFVFIALVAILFWPGGLDSNVEGEKMTFPEGGDLISLPDPDTAGGMPVEQALSQRRSRREYGADALSISEISQLLARGYLRLLNSQKELEYRRLQSDQSDLRRREQSRFSERGSHA